MWKKERMEERHQCISFKWKWCIWNRYSYATRRQMCDALHELIGFFKSQQITNNNKHLLFVVQCNNFNICLVTVDACNITTTKGAQLKEHIFWFKRSFFIPLLLVFRIFPKNIFSLCTFSLLTFQMAHWNFALSLLFDGAVAIKQQIYSNFFCNTFVVFVSWWKWFYFRAPELIVV